MELRRLPFQLRTLPIEFLGKPTADHGGAKTASEAMKEERGLGQRRDRSKLQTLSPSLGFARGLEDGHYSSREHTLNAIAKRLHESVETVSNQYHGAFELITGHK